MESHSRVTEGKVKQLNSKLGRSLGFIILTGILIILGDNHWSARAQLQQSGGPGSTVTANIGTTNGLALDATLTGGSQKTKLVDSGGTNVASVSAAGAVKVDGSGATQPVSGTFWQGTQPVSGTFWQATQPVSGTVNSIPKTACANTVASQALAAVPTSSTAVFTSTTCLQVIVLNNTNGSSVTVTVTDNAGTPINDVLTFSLPANSQLIQPLWGVAFSSGVKWSASGTGVTGAALGYQ
jgi:hypothetical protein